MREDGWTLILVLFFMAALGILAMAVHGSERAARRSVAEIVRHRDVLEAQAYAWARAESRLRARLRDPTPPRPGEVFSLAGPLSGPGLGLGFDESFPPADAPPTAAPSTGLQVRCRILPLPNERFRRTTFRDPDTGRPTSRRAPVVHLPAASPERLREVILDYLGADPLAGLAADWVVARLEELRREVRPPMDNDELVESLASRIEGTPPTFPPVAAYLASRADDLLNGLHPRARLRRTNSHPDRGRGRDRGHLLGEPSSIDPPSVDPRLSGQFTLEATVTDGRGVIHKASRTVELLRRFRLDDQESWGRSGVGLRHGVTRGGVVLGPEFLSDTNWGLGEPGFVAAPPGLDLAVLEWAPWSGGVVGVGGTTLVLVHDLGSRLELESMNLDFAARPRAVFEEWSPVARWWLGDGLHQWRLSGRGDSALRIAGADVPGSSVLPLGPWGLVVGRSHAKVVDPHEGVVESFLVPGGSPVSLPALDCVAFAAPDRWHLLDRHRQWRTFDEPGPPVGTAVQSDGVSGAFWRPDAARLGHGTLEEGRWIVRSCSAGAGQLVTFPGREIAAVVRSDGEVGFFRVGDTALYEAGTGVLAGVGQRLVGHGVAPAMYRLSAQGVTRHAVAATGTKRPRLGGHVLRRPRPDPRPALFRAPLRRDLRATFDGVRVEPTGTVNAGSSVLTGPDLSDLMVDGVLLAPLRNETLRYSSPPAMPERATLRLDRGSASVLVKPARAAADCPEPDRTRVLLRRRHSLTLELHPTVAWVAAHHPSQPPAAEIHTIQRQGPSRRDGELETRLERAPSLGVWRHVRALRLHGPAWTLLVTVGDPPVPLPPWLVDPILESTGEVVVADTGDGGQWQRLEWGWRETTQAWLRGGGESGSWGPVGPVFPPETFEMEAGPWVLELGGDELGGGPTAKAFHGTVTDLRIADGMVDEAIPWLAIFSQDPAGLRWDLPEPLPAGARFRRVAAAGAFPVGTSLEWELEGRGERGAKLRVTGGGRELETLPGVVDEAVVWTLRVALTSAGEATPLVEGVEVEWIPPVDHGSF